MTTITLDLLPETEHGVPSGNYDGSSLDWAGNAQKAANYYLSSKQNQSIRFQLTGFVGIIKIQATLDTDADDTTVWVPRETVGDGIVALTVDTSVAIPGRFTWIRAQVLDFTAGTIDSVTITY